MNYGTNLMFLKDRNGLNNVQMAAIIQKSDSLYSRYEKEKQTIPLIHLNTYANYFKTSIDFLFGFNDNKQYLKCKKNIDLKKSSKRLVELRKELKLTQLVLSKQLSFDNSTISKYENGSQMVSTPFLYTICKKYNISADYLLGKIDSPKYLK